VRERQHQYSYLVPVELPPQEEQLSALSKGVDAQGFFSSVNLKSDSQFPSCKWSEKPFKSSWIFPLTLGASYHFWVFVKTSQVSMWN